MAITWFKWIFSAGRPVTPGIPSRDSIAQASSSDGDPLAAAVGAPLDPFNGANGGAPEHPREPPAQVAAAWAEFLNRLGTNLWRLRHKMLDPATAQPLETMRRVFPQVESMWDDLEQFGIEVRDHTGDTVPDGGVFGLKIIALQPTPGITRELVIETIKPTVYFRGQTIQMGEVIVGTADYPTISPLSAVAQPVGESHREDPSEPTTSAGATESDSKVPSKRSAETDETSDWSEANKLYQDGDSKP